MFRLFYKVVYKYWPGETVQEQLDNVGHNHDKHIELFILIDYLIEVYFAV